MLRLQSEIQCITRVDQTWKQTIRSATVNCCLLMIHIHKQIYFLSYQMKSLAPPTASKCGSLKVRHMWGFKKCNLSHAVLPCYQENDQRSNSVRSADIKEEKKITSANEVPPGEPCLCIQMTCWRIQQLNVLKYWGHGVVLMVFQSN